MALDAHLDLQKGGKGAIVGESKNEGFTGQVQLISWSWGASNSGSSVSGGGLGFLPLLHYKDTDKAVFIGSQSSQKPKTYFDPGANANAELSTKLNYMLCVSRFAHYLKVMARDKVGSFAERDTMETWLNNWINNYIHPSPSTASPEGLAARPLADATVAVTEVKGKPGYYQAVAHLRPHFQLEGLATSMRLVAELPQKK